jgi:hypothetical protein
MPGAPGSAPCRWSPQSRPASRHRSTRRPWTSRRMGSSAWRPISKSRQYMLRAKPIGLYRRRIVSSRTVRPFFRVVDCVLSAGEATGVARPRRSGGSERPARGALRPWRRFRANRLDAMGARGVWRGSEGGSGGRIGSQREVVVDAMPFVPWAEEGAEGGGKRNGWEGAQESLSMHFFARLLFFGTAWEGANEQFLGASHVRPKRTVGEWRVGTWA